MSVDVEALRKIVRKRERQGITLAEVGVALDALPALIEVYAAVQAFAEPPRKRRRRRKKS